VRHSAALGRNGKVKLMTGQTADETGLVVSVANNVVIFLSDMSMQELCLLLVLFVSMQRQPAHGCDSDSAMHYYTWNHTTNDKHIGKKEQSR
jgi:hypothetical protein